MPPAGTGAWRACFLPPESRMPERPLLRDDSSTDPEPPRSGGPCDADAAGTDDPHDGPHDDAHDESHDPYQPL